MTLRASSRLYHSYFRQVAVFVVAVDDLGTFRVEHVNPWREERDSRCEIQEGLDLDAVESIDHVELDYDVAGLLCRLSA